MSRPHLKELLSKKEVDPAKEDTLDWCMEMTSV